MKTRIRAGIVGTGFMAHVHARAIRDAGHEVVAIAGSSASSSQKAAEDLDVPKSFNSWRDLVQSESVDVVHVCTPNEFHAEISIAAAEAGKHVVCEKPISVSLEQALEMQKALNDTSVGFAIPFAYRFYPVVREIRQRIANGEAGVLHLVHGSYLQDWLADSESSNWRVDSTTGGASRAFADIGSHWCDLLEFVTGERIVRVMANTSKAYSHRGQDEVTTEDLATVIFETKTGISGSLTVSQVSFGRKNQLLIELDGSKASYIFNQERPDSFLVGGRNSNQVVSVSQHSPVLSADARRLSRLPAGHPQGYQDAFNNFVADAYSGFLGHEIDGVPQIADGVRAAILIEAVLRSARTRAWVEVQVVAESMQPRMMAS